MSVLHGTKALKSAQSFNINACEWTLIITCVWECTHLLWWPHFCPHSGSTWVMWSRRDQSLTIQCCVGSTQWRSVREWAPPHLKLLGEGSGYVCAVTAKNSNFVKQNTYSSFVNKQEVLDSLACPDKNKINEHFYYALKFCQMVSKLYLFDGIGGKFDRKNTVHVSNCWSKKLSHINNPQGSKLQDF